MICFVFFDAFSFFDGKKEVGELYYPKFTLSVAMRKDDKGAAVYVADYLSGQPLERIYADGDRDFWMTSQEALEYGMIDEILTKKK